MAGAELGEPQRQVAVALQALVEDLHVPRAVHRLHRVVARLRLGEEHVLAEIVPVPRALPQRDVEHLRRPHLGIAVLVEDAPHVLLDALPDHPAPRVPEHHAGRLVLGVEQIELLAELAVVALLRLLQPVQVGVLVLLLRPRRAVDPLQHLVLRVAAPVGARHLHQLEHLQLAGGRHVRPAAQIDEIVLPVERDRLAGGNRRDDLGLVVLALVPEELHRLVARHHLALDLEVALRDLLHALLDRGEVFRRERPLVGEIVVEAVLDHRADGDLRVGEQLLHRVRQQVRRGMPQDLQPVADPCR